MGDKTKAALWTSIISIINSVCVIVFNLVFNNYLIRIYGSEINGLISTLTQFVSLFAIIEGGFTTAAVVSTYSPIVNRNYDLLNGILYTTKKTFLRLGGIITVSVLAVGSVYILLIDSPLRYFETYALLGLSVFTTASSLCFLSKYTVLLQGDNKEYIQVFASLAARALTWVLSIILVILRASIILVYAINILNVGLNILFVAIYERKHYPFARYEGAYDRSLIHGTKDVLFQKIANTVFTSTDLVLITVCISLSYASVYNLYFQVFRSLLTLLTSFAQAPFNSFGHLYKETDGKTRFVSLFNTYQHLVLMASTIVLTIAGTMIIPFVRVYSRAFTDFNYVYPSLAFLFFSQMFAQIVNRPYGIVLNASGNFKMQNIQCGLAAIINIIISVAFIKPWGINSIILGSFVGTLVILFMNIYQAYKYVLLISAKKPVRTIAINFISALLIIGASMQIELGYKSYWDLVLLAILYSATTTIMLVAVNYLCDSESTKDVFAFARGLVVGRLGKKK